MSYNLIQSPHILSRWILCPGSPPRQRDVVLSGTSVVEPSAHIRLGPCAVDCPASHRGSAYGNHCRNPLVTGDALMEGLGSPGDPI